MNDSLVRLALVPANITRLHADDDAIAATRDADDDDDDDGGSVAFQSPRRTVLADQGAPSALRAPLKPPRCVCAYSRRRRAPTR